MFFYLIPKQNVYISMLFGCSVSQCDRLSRWISNSVNRFAGGEWALTFHAPIECPTERGLKHPGWAFDEAKIARRDGHLTALTAIMSSKSGSFDANSSGVNSWLATPCKEQIAVSTLP